MRFMWRLEMRAQTKYFAIWQIRPTRTQTRTHVRGHDGG